MWRRLVTGALLAASASALPSLSLVSARARRLFGVRATLAGGGVALTFDDGPHPQGTPAVLDVLDREGAPATFFLVGEQVRRRPELAAEICAAGHAVGVHCFEHRQLMSRTPRAVARDLARAHGAIGAATGHDARLYRPPYGVLTAPALLYARRRGWDTILWRRDGHDWEQRATAASIAARLLRGLEDADILLLHDSDAYSAPGSWRATAAALPRVIEEIRAAGLALVPLERPGRGSPVG